MYIYNSGPTENRRLYDLSNGTVFNDLEA